MFSTNIVESDAFLDMPLTAQSLYFHLNMNADNDGFVNPKRIMRMIGAANDDLQILIAKRFLLSFDSGVVVIKHWWINNTKRADRHVPTTYQNELKELYLKQNKSYTKDTTQLALLTEEDTKWQPNDNQRLPQYNTMQLNAAHVQYNSNQAIGNHKKDLKKSRTLDKKAYAQAVRADEALQAREQAARARPPSKGTLDVSELFGGKT